MSCEMYQGRIEKELDDFGRIADSDVSKHLESCAECQGWLRGLNRIANELKKASIMEMSSSEVEGIRVCVLDKIREESSSQRGFESNERVASRKIAWRVCSAAAAVLMIAFGLTMYLQKDNTGAAEPVDGFVLKLPDHIDSEVSTLVGAPEKMYQTEIEYLQADFMKAVGFIQKSLPQTLLAMETQGE